MKINATKGLKPVGYSELIRQYGLEVIPNYVSSFIAEKGRSRTIIDSQLRTEIYKKGYDPGGGLKDHLIFALKYEGRLYSTQACFKG